MTKDRVNYRLSKKHAHGAEDVERSIGITRTRYSRNGNAQRPVALMKWAFDDYVVEEELPEDIFVPHNQTNPPAFSALPLEAAALPQKPTPSKSPLAENSAGSSPTVSPATNAKGGATSFVVQLLSEGVADTVVENLLRERLPRSMSFHFLTPVDFVSCASRYAWLRCGEEGAHTIPRAFWRDQHWHTGGGDIYVSPVRRIKVSAKAAAFPTHLLPRTRYTVTFRNIQSSLGDVLPQLRSVAQRGFLNYSHVARHGMGLSQIYEDAKLLLGRDYPAFLHHHVRRLSEGTTHVYREMPLLLEVLGSPRSSKRDWAGVLSGMEQAVQNDAQVYARARQSGLYPPHHDLLIDFVRRAADIMPRHHDSAQLIREAVKPLVLQETLHAITDVHFNALASLRWEQSGEAVVVGDMVRVAAASMASAGEGEMDRFVGAADHINGCMTSLVHRDWSSAEKGMDDDVSSWVVKRITSRAEAANYTVEDVVLPTFGRGTEELLRSVDGSPQAVLFANLVRELRIEGLAEMNLAPRAAFRPLVQRPHNTSFYLVDEKRGWDWEEDAGAAALKKAMHHDQDGVLRYRSPLAQRSAKNMVARIGIRDEVARNFFLKPVRKPGMTCVMQMTLPAGSHATSAIREAFTVATLSPSSIFRLLRK